jgi:hypothetical protein
MECSSMAELLLQNLDFVVDGLTAQLRELQPNSNGPQLLAAVLQKAGITAQLLPALAEPASCAITNLSIIARCETLLSLH